MHPWHHVDRGDNPEEKVSSIIEVPKGSQIKYELDKKSGLMRVDRILYSSVHYPANYGFIPRTYADDKDPLDVLVLFSPEIYPLTLVKVRPIGVVRMVDGGDIDDKIIGVLVNDPTSKDYHSVNDLPSHIFDEIMHFFKVYKQLENKKTAVKSLYDKDKAIEIIQQAIDDYKAKFDQ